MQNNQKVQGRRKPENPGIGSQENRDRGAAEVGNDKDVEQGAITGEQAAGTSGAADVLLQLKEAIHDIRQTPVAQPVKNSQHLCATSSQSVAAPQPPSQSFVAPHHTSAACLQSVAAFLLPTLLHKAFVTPQNPFSVHAPVIAGPPLPTPPGYTAPCPAYPSVMPSHAATMQPPPFSAYYQYPRPW